MKRIVAITLLFYFLLSCDNKFPNYIEKETSVYMELNSFGDGSRDFKSSNYVAATIEVIDEKGLLCRRYKEELMPLENNDFSFLMKHLTEGDSASFMVSVNRMKHEFKSIAFENTLSEYVEVCIKVHHYFTEEEYLTRKQDYDKEMVEQLLLTKYLEDVNANYSKGIYIEHLKAGKGKAIKKGDVITIGYRGYFIDRLEFDKIAGKTAFTFAYGTPGQVIKGLDIAINGMKKGEKSKIIIPSQLAFGEEGSTTLVVPPFTTVIYELNIINVK